MKTILALLLALAWMPLAAHCQLERLTGLEVLRCASAEAGGPVDDTHCGGQACCAWESGLYHLPQSQPVAAAPLAVVLAQVVGGVADETPTAATDRVLADTPPDFPRPWQFSYRAALPPRAPSIAS